MWGHGMVRVLHREMPEPPMLGAATALILAGGLGTRLAEIVPDRPKPLADVAGRPFVTWILDQLAEVGVGRVVLCIGHRGDQMRATLGSRYGRLALGYSEELVPLGTGGALRLAAVRDDGTEPVLVLNGDSFCDVDLGALWARHHTRGAAATMVVTEVPDAERFGTVRVDTDGRVAAFAEKGARGRALVNAGIYVIARPHLLAIPAGRAVSLEREVLPRWVGHGFFAHPTAGRFLDIGTPPAYARAAGVLEEQRPRP